MLLELGEPIDHFHGWLPSGEEVIVWHDTDLGGDWGWKDLFGWTHEPRDFTRIEGHRFHGSHIKLAKEQEVEEPKPGGWFTRLMKRLVSW